MNLARLPANLVVREYTPDDKDACLDVFRSNADSLPPDHIDAYEAWLDMGTSYLLVVEHDGAIVATGGLEIQGGEQNSNHLSYGLVKREHQRQGLGSLLTLTRLVLAPPDHDPAFVGLETSVLTEPFYKRFGFERLSKPVSRYAGASYYIDMGLWLPFSQKTELLALLQALPVEFHLDFEESMAVAGAHATGEEDEEQAGARQ